MEGGIEMGIEDDWEESDPREEKRETRAFHKEVGNVREASNSMRMAKEDVVG